ncbi:PREDICTED: ribosomal RNA-processing protein 8 isoform X2 [Nelumbo nucifera]|uniref:Ribosomal RNA-processing protein 8 n=1 Tax=Nelumbo nucifera TaxID=4432 RepID=A0A1U7Z872_NELNU|nr:PREDICTED: ribosomal RNA-processing protein 8 isoform X2 [Nelumbo nucifera]
MEVGKRKRERRRRRRARKSSREHNQKRKEEEVAHLEAQEENSAIEPESKRRKTHTVGHSNASNFLDKMRARLSGGHFRMLNEKLYTCSGDEALKFFQEDPALFDVYHAGYQEQMSHWPEQPVNIITNWLKGQSPSLTVADFGCGDGRLARNVKNKVFSFDLVSNDPSIIACDMSNEAHRVLKPCGWLLIAEVKSRFDPNNGGADPNGFLKAVCELGFNSVSKDFSNKMFVLFFFKKKKASPETKEIEWPELKPCIYKRR